MRKKLKISAIIIMMIILCFAMCGKVKAATSSVDLKASVTTAKPGDSFTVILSAESDNGISTIGTTISYDENVLELTASGVADESKFANAGSGTVINVAVLSLEVLKSEDIYILTFKVKDDAVDGDTTISTSSILFYSDTDMDSGGQGESLEAKSVNVTIDKDATEPTDPTDPTKPTDPTEPTDPTDPTNPTDPTDPTEPTDPTNPTEPTEPTDPTTSTSTIPQTGVTNILMPITLMMIIAVASFMGYRKYRGI